MRNNLKVYLTGLFLFVFTCILLSQPSKILSRPPSYEKPTGSIEAFHKIIRGGKNLIVMVDRSDTPCYTDETGSKETKKLNFRDLFYAIGEKGEFLKLAKYNPGPGEDQPLVENSLVLKNPIVVGWVKKANLLLWNISLHQSDMFKRKALPAARNPDVILNPKKYVGDKAKSIMCYSNPVNFGANNTESIQLGLFNFFFIYKEQEVVVNGKSLKMYLVGDNEFYSFSAPSEIRGWVSEDVLYPWDSRVCIQPCFTDRDDLFKERKKNNTRAYVFSNPQEATTYKISSNGSLLIDIEDPETKGIAVWESSKYRLPILDYNQTDVYAVGCKSPIVSASGKSVDEVKKRAIEETIKQLRTINIVIAYDAQETTISLTDISSAVNILKENFERVKDRYNINYAFVAYGGANSTIVKSEFTSDAKIFTDELYKRKVEINSITESSNLESAFIESTKLFKRNNMQAQSNYLLIFGGRGETELNNIDQVTKLFDEVNLNMFVYQFNRQSSSSYVNFVKNIAQIAREGNSVIYNKLSAEKDPRTGKSYELTKFDFEMDLSSNPNYNTVKAKKGKGFIRYSDVSFPSKAGTSLDKAEFEKDLRKFIGEVTSTTQALVEDLKNSVVEKREISPLVLNQLLRMKNLDDTEKENILSTYGEGNFEFFSKVYIPRNFEVQGQIVYEQVVFFTEAELNQLIDVLTSFAKTKDENDENAYREAVYNFFLEQASSIFGAREASAALRKMKPKEIFEKMLGITSATIWTSIENIDCIRQKSCGNYENVLKIGRLILAKRDGLAKAKSNDLYRWAPDNGISYYWLPINLLP